MFEVGGCVRDEIMGLPSKDIDYTIVLEPGDLLDEFEDPFVAMHVNLWELGFKVFVISPEFLTIRARFPKTDVEHSNLTADFVLARKESGYTDGRRPDRVEPGTLIDDLRRRDFTMNAIAKDTDGSLIDPFNGRDDIEDAIIRCVGDPDDRFAEDSLRMLRAIRFSVTKGFVIHPDVTGSIWNHRRELTNVSGERVREELDKMFRHDWLRSFELLREHRMLDIIQDMGVGFKPTFERKYRQSDD